VNSTVQIGPIDLRDYLKSQGWTVLQEATRDRLFVFSNSNFPRRQIIFPMDQSAPDYTEAVALAMHKLGEILSLNPVQVATRIQEAKDDVLRLRVAFEGNDSTLPLSFATALIQNTEKLLKAAACTVMRPRAHHPKLALNEATNFVENARFGQTQIGSFILKVACPIYAMDIQGQLTLDGQEVPFVRNVTSTLYRALNGLATAIETDMVDSLVEQLKTAEQPLISSNLCEAISNMHDDQVNNQLDLSFDWSVLRAPSLPNASRVLSFQSDYFPRIEEVRQELRRAETDQIDTFIGTVEALEGEMGPDGRRFGYVVLSLLIREESESIRVRMFLAADDYAKAAFAHTQHGAYVAVTGRLRPGRQPRQLLDVSVFNFISSERLSYTPTF